MVTEEIFEMDQNGNMLKRYESSGLSYDVILHLGDLLAFLVRIKIIL